MTCLLANQELFFRHHDQPDPSLNRDEYIEFLQLLKDYDSVLNDHPETATLFKGILPAIQNDLIKARHKVTLDEFKSNLRYISAK